MFALLLFVVCSHTWAQDTDAPLHPPVGIFEQWFSVDAGGATCGYLKTFYEDTVKQTFTDGKLQLDDLGLLWEAQQKTCLKPDSIKNDGLAGLTVAVGTLPGELSPDEWQVVVPGWTEWTQFIPCWGLVVYKQRGSSDPWKPCNQAISPHKELPESPATAPSATPASLSSQRTQLPSTTPATRSSR